ncbi:MAG: hypothetical protein KJ879_01720, partial [Nanoarchaeota archaeon]|nr:hypothetical protein [Nanoarchaeota archaeon]
CVRHRILFFLKYITLSLFNHRNSYKQSYHPIFMGMLGERFSKMGYNAREQAYIYGGAAIGVIAPLVATRLLVSTGIESNFSFVQV